MLPVISDRSDADRLESDLELNLKCADVTNEQFHLPHFFPAHEKKSKLYRTTGLSMFLELTLPAITQFHDGLLHVSFVTDGACLLARRQSQK